MIDNKNVSLRLYFMQCAKMVSEAEVLQWLWLSDELNELNQHYLPRF